MAEVGILVAATGATFDYEGRQVWIREGITTVRAGHPLLKGREGLFKPLVVDFELTAPAQPKPAPAPAAAKAAAAKGTGTA